MILIGLLVIFTILFRSVYYYMLQGVHDGLYYLKLDNVREALQYCTVGVLLLGYRRKSSCLNNFIKFGSVFCFSLAVLMMYPFLPLSIAKHAGIVLTSFYTIWAIIGVSLLGYYIFCLRRELT